MSKKTEIINTDEKIGSFSKEDIESYAQELLNKICGKPTKFREGQLEAINAILTNQRTLVVQRTGWGKSFLYFVACKIIRELNRGFTLVMSPLLVLMDNQLEQAKNIGLNAKVFNSSVSGRNKKRIMDSVMRDEVDLLFITPESLFTEQFQANLKDVGFIVVDEAHCMSDWGHDFRLKYGKLHKIINQLPNNVPVLCTTATASDRVVKDLESQFGNEIVNFRGSLFRESLAIDIVHLNGKASKYIWILENINKFPGTGIIYCLTKRDCENLAMFLVENGISARPYYSGKGDTALTEKEFMNNEIKVIVATIKLGMGYDKGDISFVIHFQKPQNLVSYYQQIGRAGRNINHASIVLLVGDKEDDEILNHFIDNAFPKEEIFSTILDSLENSDSGLKISEIMAKINSRKKVVYKAIDFLCNDGYIIKDKYKYHISPKNYSYPHKHYDEITKIRRKENKQVNEFISTDKCYSKFLLNALDDYSNEDCGKCSNCLGKDIVSKDIDYENIELAQEFLNTLYLEINPRKMWAKTDSTKYSKIRLINKPGISLSKYGDDGFGELVKVGKTEYGAFSDKLVKKTSEILKDIVKEEKIQGVVPVPSLRSDIVKEFAKKVADGLDIGFYDVLIKSDVKPQKDMENSSFLCKNALDSFSHNKNNKEKIPKKLLLIDDTVDSRWTLTVCGSILREKFGVSKVIPYTLADDS
ncbi:MAG: RecQ family ATP-dependent DNA helicase [Methanobrevibacter sp.]|jgi:ATP-dependent DNA helicase RecQ|nr:RecQ family ATP-dependent DNA helicase [Methanobrevibacter sp.]